MVDPYLQYSPDHYIVDEAKEQIRLTIEKLCSDGWWVYNPAGNRVCRGWATYEYAFLFQKIAAELDLGPMPCIGNSLAIGGLELSRIAWNGVKILYNIKGLGAISGSNQDWSDRMVLYALLIEPLQSTSDVGIYMACLASIYGLGAFEVPGLAPRAREEWAYGYRNMEDGKHYEDLSWLDAAGGYLHGYYPRFPKNYYAGRMGASHYACLEPNTKPSTFPDNHEIHKIPYDYMLMNNFTRLSFPEYSYNYWDMGTGHYGNYENSLIRNVTANYPIGPFGTATNPLTVQASYVMNLEANLGSNSRVNFNAPHVTLLPGFDSGLGAVSEITNSRLDCNLIYDDGVNFGAKTEEDTINYEPDSLSYEDSVALMEWYHEMEETYIADADGDLVLAATLWAEDFLDDEAKYSSIVTAMGGEEVKNTLFLTLSPNPATEVTKASFYLPWESYVSLTLVDNLGNAKELVAKDKLYNQGNYVTEIPVQDLAPGIYSVVLQTTKQTAFAKLIVQ